MRAVAGGACEYAPYGGAGRRAVACVLARTFARLVNRAPAAGRGPGGFTPPGPPVEYLRQDEARRLTRDARGQACH